MSTSAKKTVKCAIILIIVGVIIVFGALLYVKFDFSKLNTFQIDVKTYSVSEDFDHIRIEGARGDIYFTPSEDNKCKVVANEREKTSYIVKVVDGELIISMDNHLKWYDNIVFFSWGMKTEKITIYLPKSEYETLLVKKSYGDIKLPEDFDFKNIDITTTSGNVRLSGGTKSDDINIKTASGDITVKDIKTNKIYVQCTSGNIKLSDVVAADTITVKTSSGDVKLNRSDAAHLCIKTSSGNVSGSLLTDKRFNTHTSSGNIHVPDSVTGGECEIRTSSGDITIKIVKSTKNEKEK